MNVVRFSEVEEKILKIRGESVILDSDVAAMYEVGTNLEPAPSSALHHSRRRHQQGR